MRNRHLITQTILSGKLNSTQLETLIAPGGDYAGTWKALLKARDLSILLASPLAQTVIFGSSSAIGGILELAGAELAGSDAATAAIFGSASSAKLVFTTPSYFSLWRDNSANYTRLKSLVNASGSVLTRQEWTSDGSYSVPSGGLAWRSILLIAPGGYGGGASNTVSGGGGSGGEIVCDVDADPSGMTGSYSVAVNAGANATFGALASAARGNTASGQTGGTAAGSTTGGGGASMTDTDYSNAVAQLSSFSEQGANGGYGGSYGGSGTAGGASYFGAGGVGGVGTSAAYASSTSAYGGSAPGAGGGGGGSANGSYGVGGSGMGTATPGAGCSGAGAGYYIGSAGNPPTAGLALLYGIRNVAA